MFRRLLQRLFKGYQLMLLEPAGGQTVRHMRINIATVLGIVLLLLVGPAIGVWYCASNKTEDVSAHFFQLQKKNQELRDKLATGAGELGVAKGQIDGLRQQLVESQQQIEKLKESQTIYESILEARKSGGVRILRAEARIEQDDPLKGPRRLAYSIVIVKGGNYPRHVSGSVSAVATGPQGQTARVKFSDKDPDLQYTMDTHIFLEGNVIWTQDWLPVKLHLLRMNARGDERDQMDIDVDENPLK